MHTVARDIGIVCIFAEMNAVITFVLCAKSNRTIQLYQEDLLLLILLAVVKGEPKICGLHSIGIFVLIG
jgi:uncharacterized membrane protein